MVSGRLPRGRGASRIALVLALASLGPMATRGSRPAAAQAPTHTRIALVNIIQVIKNFHKFKAFNEDMAKLAKPYEDKDKELVNHIQQWKDHIAKATLTAEKRAEAEQALKTLQRQREDNAEKAKKDLSKRNDEAMVQLYREVEERRDSGANFRVDASGTAEQPIVITAADRDARPTIHSCDPADPAHCPMPAMGVYGSHVIVDHLAIRGRIQVWGATSSVIQHLECTHGWGACGDGNWSCLRIESCTGCQARFNLVHVLSREPQDIELLHGRIDRAKADALFERWVPIADVDYAFVCGPEGMMDAVRDALTSLGFPRDRVREEQFSSPEQRHGAVPTTPQPVTITVRGRKKDMIAAAGQTLLEAGLEAGLPMPFSCTMGGCGACKATLRSGRVVAEEPNCLTPEEARQGLVLPCVSRPASPVTLEVA